MIKKLNKRDSKKEIKGIINIIIKKYRKVEKELKKV